jgi:hypothetical protein
VNESKEIYDFVEDFFKKVNVYAIEGLREYDKKMAKLILKKIIETTGKYPVLNTKKLPTREIADIYYGQFDKSMYKNETIPIFMFRFNTYSGNTEFKENLSKFKEKYSISDDLVFFGSENEFSVSIGIIIDSDLFREIIYENPYILSDAPDSLKKLIPYMGEYGFFDEVNENFSNFKEKFWEILISKLSHEKGISNRKIKIKPQRSQWLPNSSDLNGIIIKIQLNINNSNQDYDMIYNKETELLTLILKRFCKKYKLKYENKAVHSVYYITSPKYSDTYDALVEEDPSIHTELSRLHHKPFMDKWSHLGAEDYGFFDEVTEKN